MSSPFDSVSEQVTQLKADVEVKILRVSTSCSFCTALGCSCHRRCHLKLSGTKFRRRFPMALVRFLQMIGNCSKSVRYRMCEVVRLPQYQLIGAKDTGNFARRIICFRIYLEKNEIVLCFFLLKAEMKARVLYPYCSGLHFRFRKSVRRLSLALVLPFSPSSFCRNCLAMRGGKLRKIYVRELRSLVYHFLMRAVVCRIRKCGPSLRCPRLS